ncbi:Mu-like prophage major head subunit gpT family protein [Desulfocurvibacter africanus]|uniref:Mu-like major head subunit gpT, prophage protein n=1 Tax=Desulfocurvibacter africanus subsp. africanus str. Walvis Bay TaxID=690850 RepID=F3YW13_DESAF|nr:Mu-like prophage major head subunit gpT family protein [Desulfocurvibacter africanus]EGJ49043.1 Mu-like major head subunit gpT, prophage protein [Desulfocurvibacter africanus subsp. africanus str. Walvis Bay]
MKREFNILCIWALLLVAAVLMFPAEAVADLACGDSLALLGFGGLLVNKATIEGLFVNLKVTFNKAFEAAPSDWQKTATLVPSTGKQNDYSWFSRFPRMRKWVGDKVVKALSAFQYSLVNDDWEATVEVDRNDIEDDQLGQYGPMTQEAGLSAKQLPDEIVADLKNNAFTAKCYDGQYFYDTDHPVGDSSGSVTSVSNKLTVALSNADLAAAKASYGAARTAMMKFKDDEGRPLSLIPDLLEVPPALEEVGRMLLTADKLANDTPNPYKGTALLLVNPRLTSDTAWFLHVTTRPIKPFVYQERKKPVFVKQMDESSDDVFNRKKFKFGAEARAAGGYSLWQLSVGSTGAGS